MEDSILQEILSPIAAVLIVCIWYFFKDKKKGKTTIDDIIKYDPVLNKLDKEIGRLNKESGKELSKDRKTVAQMKARGIDIDDEDFKFDKTEFLNDFKSVLFEYGTDSIHLISHIDERLKFEKRITKTNYSKFVKICEKLDNFWNEEYDEWDDFEDEDEMKELQIKEKKFETKDIEIRNEIYDFISKSVVNK
jgi:nanoRNase/pAp phosphatase (c-di-AMP/oligoRNAs hydrolase)